MKKFKLFIIAMILIIIPFSVKADNLTKFFYTNVENVSGIDYVSYNVKYVSKMYGSTSAMTKDETRVAYILHDQNILQFGNYSCEGAEEYKNVICNAEEVKPGVVKLSIKSDKDYNDEFEYSVSFRMNVLKKTSTSIELKTQYDYEKLTCEDCDGFWMGIINKGDEMRTVDLSNNKIFTGYPEPEVDVNTPVEDNNEDVTTGSIEQDTTNNDNILTNKYLVYGLIATNAVLIILVISLLVKSKNKKEG